MKTLRSRTRISAMAAAFAGWAVAGSFSQALAAPVFNDPVDVQALTAIENDLQSAPDMKGIISDYAPDAVVFDQLAPGVYLGRDQIYQGYEPQFANVRSIVATLPELNIASDGQFACAALQAHFETTMKDGSKLTTTVRALDAFKKIDGKWQVVEEQVSAPADPKTGMALMHGPMPVREPIAWSADPIPGPPESVDAAKQEIRHYMDVGVLSTTIEQLMPYYGPGDDVLVYDSFAPGELRGLKEIHDAYAPLMGSITGVKVKMPIFVDDSDGSFGVQIDTQDIQLAMKDGSTKNISLRQSDCMRRVDGKWYSFFEMISFPMDPKTGKSVMVNPTAFQ